MNSVISQLVMMKHLTSATETYGTHINTSSCLL